MLKMVKIMFLMIYFVFVSECKVILLLRTTISYFDYHVTVSDDGNCIAVGNIKQKSVTLFRNSENGFYNESVITDKLFNFSNYQFYGTRFNRHKFFGLNADCSKIYIRTNKKFLSYDTKNHNREQLIEYENSQNVSFEIIKNDVFFYNCQTSIINYFYENGQQKIINNFSLGFNVQKYSLYYGMTGKFNRFQIDLSGNGKTIGIFYIVSDRQIAVKEIDVYTLSYNNIVDYKAKMVKDLFGMYLIAKRKYFTLRSQIQSDGNNTYYNSQAQKVLFIAQVQQFHFSGNKEYFAIIDSQTKRKISVFNFENCIAYWEEKEELITELLISQEYQILEFSLNHQGDQVTYIRKHTPLQNRLIMVSHQLGVEQTIFHTEDLPQFSRSLNNDGNQIILISCIVIISMIFIIKKIISNKQIKAYINPNQTGQNLIDLTINKFQEAQEIQEIQETQEIQESQDTSAQKIHIDHQE